MNLTTFLRNAAVYYQTGDCYYLRSGPGRGKTTTVLAAVPEIAKATGKSIGVSVISGPLLTPADTVGYLVPTKGEDGRIESKFTDPFWWRTEEGKRLEEYDGGIVFIDEADKMDVDMKKIAGEMALSGRCGPHKLPPGWVVWMAGNRVEDRSGSTKELDHLINRRCEINVTDDLTGWEQWALRNGVHHAIVSFAMNNPQIVFPDKAPDKQGPFCTPRSLVKAGAALATLGGNAGGAADKAPALPVDTDAVELTSGYIGQAAAAQLFATIRLDAETPPLSDIIKDPKGCKLPGAPDAQMLVAYKLAALAEEKTLEPVIEYIERLPADFAVTFAKALCVRQPMFVAKPPMLAWTKRHSAIMSVMAMLK